MKSMPTAVSQHTVKLPVFETLLRSLRLLVKNGLTLLKYSIPMMVGFACLFFQEEVATLLGNPFDYRVQLVTQLILFLVFMVGSVISAVAFHHTFLTEGNKQAAIFRWGGIEIRYLGWLIILFLLYFVISFVVMLVVSPVFFSLFYMLLSADSFEAVYAVIAFALTILVGFLIFYMVSTWSLVLPATVLGYREVTLAKASALGSGNRLRLTFVIFLVPILVSTVISLVLEAVLGQSFVLWGIDVLMWNPVSVWLDVVVLSASYEYLSKEVFAKNL